MPQASSTTNSLEIVEFEIGGKSDTGEMVYDTYCITVSKVREILQTPQKISRTAKDHQAMEGAIGLRGEIIPVIHLAKWLGVFSPEVKYTRVIITEFNFLRAGFLVNSVNRIHHIPYENLEPATALTRRGEREIITGVIRYRKKLIMMLDLEKVLTDIDPEIIADFDEVPEGESASHNEKSVLLVEDSGVILLALERAFKKAGYGVHKAQNPIEALEILEEIALIARKEKNPIANYVAAISSDVEMPLLNSAGFLERLKQNSALKDIPVVFFSSVESEGKINELMNLGAEGHFNKPKVGELLDRINAITFVE